MQVQLTFDIPMPALSAGSLGKLKIRDALHNARAFGRIGFTDNELVEMTGLRVNLVTARRNEMGRVRDSGIRRYNPDTGRSGTVWETY